MPGQFRTILSKFLLVPNGDYDILYLIFADECINVIAIIKVLHIDML